MQHLNSHPFLNPQVPSIVVVLGEFLQIKNLMLASPWHCSLPALRGSVARWVVRITLIPLITLVVIIVAKRFQDGWILISGAAASTSKSWNAAA